MAPDRKRWTIGGLVAVVLALAVALAVVLITDDDSPDTATTQTTVAQAGDDDSSNGTSATSSTTGSDRSSSTSATTAAPSASYVCPEGDAASLEELQSQVDAGHEPWRASAEDVASQCATGSVGATVETVGATTYRVTDPATGDASVVEVTQPVRQGPGGIWAVTSVTPVG